MHITAQLFEFCVKQSFYFTQLKLNLNPFMIVVRTLACEQALHLGISWKVHAREARERLLAASPLVRAFSRGSLRSPK